MCKRTEQIKSIAEEVGVLGVSLGRTSNNHFKIKGDNLIRQVITSSTPSCHRSNLNLKPELGKNLIFPAIKPIQSKRNNAMNKQVSDVSEAKELDHEDKGRLGVAIPLEEREHILTVCRAGGQTVADIAKKRNVQLKALRNMIGKDKRKVSASKGDKPKIQKSIRTPEETLAIQAKRLCDCLSNTANRWMNSPKRMMT